MYEYEVKEIQADEDITEEEINELRTLYQTPVGTIPMEREKGIDTSFIAMPTEVAKNMYAVELIKKTRLYTELEVTDIQIYTGEHGKLIAKVVVSRGE